MRRLQSNKKNIGLLFINIVYIFALAAVLFPLLWIAQYNYPSADDWSFGMKTYGAVKDHEGVLAVIRAVFDTVKTYYRNWEGRFSIPFLGALQPGIWGEEKYWVVTWIMLGAVIASEIFLFRTILHVGWGQKKRGLILPVLCPALILQVLYTPSVVESFYWYNGSACYTLIYAASLALLSLSVRIGIQDVPRRKYFARAFLVCCLCVFVGGGNFASSLSCLLTLILLCIVFFVYYRRAFFRMWYTVPVTGSCLLLCMFAPGNQHRLESNFDGTTTGEALWAVWTSLARTFTNIISWTNIKVILMILLILPFVWMAVKNIRFDFRYPLLFTALSFGVYASQMTATVYVNGTAGGGRMAAVLFYSYYMWVLANVCYWTGWLRGVMEKLPLHFGKLFDAVSGAVSGHLILWCAAVGVLLAGIIYTFDLKEISSYRAYRDWRQGWAQQYAEEWDARLEVLHDDSVRQVEFAPLTVYPEMLLYTDLQEDDGYIWVNSACAEYYGKESVRVSKAEE